MLVCATANRRKRDEDATIVYNNDNVGSQDVQSPLERERGAAPHTHI
jgi:hypothetical protein